MSYNSYRGRRTLHDILKWIAGILLILVVVMLCGLLFGQRYIVFHDGGLRLDLPFAGQDGGEPPDLGSVSVVIQPDASQPDDSQTEEESAMAALELPLEAMLDGSAVRLLEAAGANAVILEMKDEEGQLNWISQQELALQAGVNSGSGGMNELLEQWNQGEIYTVARVCCFRDNRVPYQRNDVALRASYGNWRDELGLRWMNPASAQAQAYLAGLCAELAELGFDEILLECCGFPTQGSLEAISMGEVQRTQVMEDFLRQVRQALEPYGTVLSVRTEEAVFTGEDDLSGLTAAALEECAGRLWLEEGGRSADLLAAAGISGGETRLVRIVPTLETQTGGAQAVLE